MAKSTFNQIIQKYREQATSKRRMGEDFERLIRDYLMTTKLYASKFAKVWMWEDFPYRKDFGGQDTGIDLVAYTYEGTYWAIQCKFFSEDSSIQKADVDSFLATSSRTFVNEDLEDIGFSNRLWVSTTNKWSKNAEDAIQNQNPPVSRISLSYLEEDEVDWAKLDQGIFGQKSRPVVHKLFDHQQEALDATHEHFKHLNRGKLIMACGTGKTFTSLKIAENETGDKGLVLFLVPSIALLGQTLREWTQHSTKDIHPICICSDSRISRQEKHGDDDAISIVDLALPASTDINNILGQLNSSLDRKGMTVVFSTYQSIEVIANAQKAYQAQEGKEHSGVFDLVICDEAHRTTGVKLKDEDASAFTKVHYDENVEAHKRLYMTATPRLYSESAKDKASESDAVLCSMDDEAVYGPEIYRIGFGEAVDRNLLSDYKVLVLTIGEDKISPTLQRILSQDDVTIEADDLPKMIGCINGLSKRLLGDADIIKASDPEPMRRAVAFCQTIKKSKATTELFEECAELYRDDLPSNEQKEVVHVSAQHIDGTMSAPEREEKLSWLKSVSDDDMECRMLTNVRCLSEGVDVPSLDSVLFLSSRNSQVDVVQSVGRVMRKSPGKKYGYIIIPVVIPVGVDAAVALEKSDRFKVVWDVLNALRSHDDRFEATINQIELNKNKPKQILIGDGGAGDEFSDGDGIAREDREKYNATSEQLAKQLNLQFEEMQSTFFARMVEKVGNKRYWEQWARDVAQIAQEHIAHIMHLIKTDERARKAFDEFLSGLHKNINPSVSEQEAVDMLAQHIITKPVFEALFDDFSFVENNPISKSMQRVMDSIEDKVADKDNVKLQRFYDSVRRRAKGIDNAEGKQKIVIELYEKFFKTAFPKTVEQLGIVYTPVEVVDFIIHSVEDVLQKEFNRSISDENIHILDPFTGTGTFITRLLSSGLIKPEDLDRKYMKELHANEIVLLAYYIASVNIENTYHDLSKSKDYYSFNGICLTDTFQLSETADGEKLFSEIFPQNSERVMEQQKQPIKVIIGNPPYSVGQKSANDNAQNQEYPTLDSRVAQTYAEHSNATNKNSLYDSYIKAFRWASDRLDKNSGGVLAFVTNGAWIDGNAMDGFRKSIETEFSSIYVFNLRGNARTQSELRRKEAGNVFGSGSRTPIAITLLVKNPQAKVDKATIHYHDIGDYLSQKEKLSIIKDFKSIDNPSMKWRTLQPNKHGDWINLRSDVFENFIQLGDKDDKKNNKTFFVPYYSNGVKTNRDAWCYNSSLISLQKNITQTLEYYNKQRVKYHSLDNQPSNKISDCVESNITQISWSDGLFNYLKRNNALEFEDKNVVESIYRPFFKQYGYYGRSLNERVYQMPKVFPDGNFENLIICVPGIGNNKDFSCLISNRIVDLGIQSASQCFPLYWYEENSNDLLDLFKGNATDKYTRRDGVSDFIAKEARVKYGHKTAKEDIFFYVYGILHSPDYRKEFEADLKKMLPRLPLVDKVDDFWAFSKAGRELAHYHLNYEDIPAYSGVDVEYKKGKDEADYTVTKLRFAKKRVEGKSVNDRSAIIYNKHITIKNIPEEAYDYEVNGRSAIEWIIDRYQVRTDKKSGITNDPNDWGREHGNERYILDLLLSVITVSMESVRIIKSLPKLDFEE